MLGYDEYVPAAHVRFLEQSGAKVIPISYHLTRSALVRLLDQVSGLYIHGDSPSAVADHEFQATFSYVISYMYQRSDVKYDYWPVFMMGASVQSLLLNRLSSTTILKAMTPIVHQNLGLRLVRDPADTYVFDELDASTVDEFVQDALVFNKQKLGLRVRDFLRESRINKRYNVVATFKTSAQPLGAYQVVDDEEYVAIMESPDYPLYIFTYEV